MKGNQFDLKDISAVIPYYDKNGGNFTKIITKQGEEITDTRRVKTVLGELVKFYALDLTMIRRKYGSFICQRNIVPIPINSEVTLVPFKLRKPLYIKDGSLGYIVLEDIKETLEEQGSNGTIILKNGTKVKTMESKKSCNKHINNGKIIKDMRARDMGNGSSFQHYNNLYNQALTPATKEDIALLVRELLVIKERIGSR